MLKMWFFVFYLDKYLNKKHQENLVIQPKVKRAEFIFYLKTEKHFLEGWRIKFYRYYRWIFSKNISQQRLNNLYQENSEKIKDVIKNCYERKIIQIDGPYPTNTSSNEYILWTDNKSRDFIKPLRFVNELLKEYGNIVSFIGGAVSTAIAWILSKIF